MKVIDLKSILCVTDLKKEVLIRSETNSIDGLRYNCWSDFYEDSNDNLILDDSAYCILIGKHVITLWVV